MKISLLAVVMVFGMTAQIALAQSDAKTTAQPTPDIGKWHVDETKSELDGNHTISAYLPAENGVFNILGRTEQPSLSLQCSKDGLYATFLWPDFVDQAAFMTLKVKWKLDDGPVQTSAWMPGMKAIGPMGRNAQVWLRDIAKGKKLVVQVPDRHGGQEAVFDITGIDVIGPRFSEAACG